ncbi:phenylalanine--tRNA ligase subunit beta [Candidatus Saccharibacteria bacterium]|nr:phenylalanine--tRNA ligase subunit beta [Candidatus Saccharibacteria bacterium]
MKVSISWIRDINSRYQSSADPMPGGIDELVERIGSQLGAVDELIDLGKKYKGIVVAKIISCEKHPNADKLSICLIDDGGVVKGVSRNKQGLVQVVCGASNVRAALLVAWIPPGVVVPSTFDNDPLVLERREIRGIASNGMLASPKELGLGDNQEGILIIDEQLKPGSLFAGALGLDDYIIDIENKMFTHRPDLFGMLGIARELAGIQGHVFRSPAWYRHNTKLPNSNSRDTHPLRIDNQISKLVPRFMAAVLKDVKIKPSPNWLATRLAAVGVKPINNIVDLTNYFMLETGQPLHAYDYDKLKALNPKSKHVSLGIRMSKHGESLSLIGKKEIALQKGGIVITAGNIAVGLGGVMGGSSTEVDNNTKNVVLECATFDMNTTRKTAMSYGLYTDAATRFTKGQSPLQNTAVLAKVVEEAGRQAGGRLSGKIHDDNHLSPSVVKSGSLHSPVKVAPDFINSRLGLQLLGSQIEKLLLNVEFKIIKDGNGLVVTAPFWRTDIEIPEDIVEEVGRLYGYDHLPLVLPQRDTTPAVKNQKIMFKYRLRNLLASAGGNEVLTYSFVKEALLKGAYQDPKDAYHVRNALSPDLQYYRPSLVPSLLEKVHLNIKSGFDRFLLFELGVCHVKAVIDSEGLPTQLNRLSVVTSSGQKDLSAPYYHARQMVEYLAERLNINKIEFRPLTPGLKLSKQWEITAAAYEPYRFAAVVAEDAIVGLVGEPCISLRQLLKLPTATAMLELDIDILHQKSSTSSYKPLNKYPETSQDICLRTDIDMSFEKINKVVSDETSKLGSKYAYQWGLKPLDIFHKKGDSLHKQITWRVSLVHNDRTLTTGETNKFIDELAKEVHVKIGATKV